jgi:serine-type D-Ala-D-Ala carboxypeptidase (penicillin-binding protein 5/6)
MRRDRPVARRPILFGGARRRARWPRVVLGALVLAAAAVVGVALLGSEERDTRSPAVADSDRKDTPGSGRRASAGQASRSVGSAADRGAPLGPGAPGAPARRLGGSDAAHLALELSRPDLVRLKFVRKPEAGLMFDVKRGRVLWRLNPTRRLPIASLTKMMTALLVVEREDPHDRVRISKRAVTTAGSGTGVLPRGKKVQLEALLNGLLLVSGNDAAVALSEHTAGGVGDFVSLMNRRAAELGLFCTRFSSPHGLKNRGNRSCPVDLGVLARAALAERRIRRIARRDRAVLKFPIKGGRLFLYNNNPLIRSGYRGTTGLKTGYTEKAGRSMVATVKRGRTELCVILLDSYNPAEQAKKLFRRGFRALRRSPPTR